MMAILFLSFFLNHNAFGSAEIIPFRRPVEVIRQRPPCGELTSPNKFVNSFRTFRRIEPDKDIVLPPLSERRWVVITKSPEMIEALMSPIPSVDGAYVTSLQELHDLVNELGDIDEGLPDRLARAIQSEIWLPAKVCKASAKRFYALIEKKVSVGMQMLATILKEELEKTRIRKKLHVFDYEGEEI